MHLQKTYLESTVLIKFFTREPPAAAILMRIVTTTIDYVDTKRVMYPPNVLFLSLILNFETVDSYIFL